MSPKYSADTSTRADERVMVFIDGSNLYHVLGEICGRHDLQFDKFGTKLANGRNLRRVYYYNIKQDADRPADLVRDQDKFLATLHDTPYLEVRLGILKHRGDEMVEKGVDVMLATDVVVKALKDLYDTAIVVSGDADFFPAYQAAKDAGKHVEVAAFDSNLSPEAARVADNYIRLTKSWFTGLWTSRRGSDGERRADEPAELASATPARTATRGRRRITGSDAPQTRPSVSPAPSIAEAPTEQERVPARRTAARTVPVASEQAPLADQTPVRRTAARRRVGGTIQRPSQTGQDPVEVTPSEASDSPETVLPASLVKEPGPAIAESDEHRPATARRAGWLRRLGITPDGSPADESAQKKDG